MTAAKAISTCLTSLGISNKTKQAVLVGEDRAAWNLHCNGHRRPLTSKVVGWLESALERGYAIQIEATAAGWMARGRLRPPANER